MYTSNMNSVIYEKSDLCQSLWAYDWALRYGFPIGTFPSMGDRA